MRIQIAFELDAQERAALISELAAALAGADTEQTGPTGPALEDVQSYADARGWEPRLFDPVAFHRYNTLRGWPIKDWKLAADGWYGKQRHAHPEWIRPNYSEWEG